MGPQVSYFMPQILLEQDLHGPDIDAIGASFPGVSPYVLLGHGQDFAWSATSAGQDIIDTFAEKLCEPDGSAPTCSRRTTSTRATAADGDPHAGRTRSRPTRVTRHRPRLSRSRHSAPCTGSSTSAARVDGEPVAFVRQRSTYFHEADSARAFADLNRPSKVQNVQDFQRVVSRINFTFNWFYSDNRDIGYFNSGDNPVRAPGADPELPTWGTGEYDWQGWETTFKTAHVHALRGAPAGGEPVVHHLVEQQAGARLRRRGRQLRLRAGAPLAVARRADPAAARRRGQDEPAGADRLDGGRR